MIFLIFIIIPIIEIAIFISIGSKIGVLNTISIIFIHPSGKQSIYLFALRPTTPHPKEVKILLGQLQVNEVKNSLLEKVLFILIGITIGLWISWPGIIAYRSWSCAIRFTNKKRPNSELKTKLKIYPKYFLRKIVTGIQQAK